MNQYSRLIQNLSHTDQYNQPLADMWHGETGGHSLQIDGHVSYGPPTTRAVDWTVWLAGVINNFQPEGTEYNALNLLPMPAVEDSGGYRSDLFPGRAPVEFSNSLTAIIITWVTMVLAGIKPALALVLAICGGAYPLPTNNSQLEDGRLVHCSTVEIGQAYQHMNGVWRSFTGTYNLSTITVPWDNSSPVFWNGKEGKDSMYLMKGAPPSNWSIAGEDGLIHGGSYLSAVDSLGRTMYRGVVLGVSSTSAKTQY